MDPKLTLIRSAIEAFSFDDGQPALTFEFRLAREHGWSRSYTRRVLTEYRRFLFLAIAGEEPVCPSEDVDAAWHMHLTHTRSYWTHLCGEVLGRPLHHEPTRGGPHEAEKHRQMYDRTLAIYREAFGAEPPTDVWPSAEVRFGTDLNHRNINTARNWVLPKAPVCRVAGLIAAVCMAFFVTGCAGGWNPFDLVGVEYLLFLVPTMVAAIIAGRVLRALVRKPAALAGDETRTLTWEETAYLKGGYSRLTTAAIARLVAAGFIKISDDKKTLIPGESIPAPNELSPSETGVYSVLPLANTAESLRSAHAAVETRYSAEADRLQEEGLLMAIDQKLLSIFVALIPLFLVIILFGVPRLIMGSAAQKHVGYLVVAIVMGGGLSAFLAVVGSLRLTRRGVYLLKITKNRNRTLRRARAWESPTDAGMALACFGTVALADSSLKPLADWYPHTTTSCGGGCGAGCGGPAPGQAAKRARRVDTS